MMKLSFTIVFVLVELAVTAQSHKIDELMKRYQSYDQFNGTVLVADKGKIIYQHSFGFADFEWKTPLTNDTKYDIASVTKTFTALLIMQLVEKSKIRLDGPISNYLPEYPAETGKKITIRQLLDHSSGIQRDIGDFPTSGNNFPDIVAKINEDFLSIKEQTALIAKRPLLFEPGTSYSYSSDGNVVLGRIIEVVTGKTYEQALHEMILQPLGLKATGYTDHYTIIGKKATGYAETYLGLRKGRQIGISPAGGIYSTAQDLLQWDQALYTNRIINQSSKDLLFTRTPYIVGNGWKVNDNYFKVTDSDSTKTVVSSGALPGFNILITRFINDNKTIIILENIRRINYKHDEITKAIAAILYNKPYTFPKRSLAKSISDTIQLKGLAAAKKFYDGYKKKPGDFQLNEAEINNAGYALINAGEINEAIWLFTVNTIEFPNSSNAFDSLGEAYMIGGDTQKAIGNYKLSLALNPGNDNAAKMIEKLMKGQN